MSNAERIGGDFALFSFRKGVRWTRGVLELVKPAAAYLVVLHEYGLPFRRHAAMCEDTRFPIR